MSVILSLNIHIKVILIQSCFCKDALSMSLHVYCNYSNKCHPQTSTAILVGFIHKCHNKTQAETITGSILVIFDMIFKAYRMNK